MSLGTEQEAFSRDVVKLLLKAFELGFEIRIGECWRPQAMQDLYLAQGKSKTANSQHTKKLAIDLNLMIGGKLATREQTLELGRFWEALSSKNRWGGSWRGAVEAKRSSFIDAPHFERQG